MSLVMKSGKVNQSKSALEKDGAIQFEPEKNAGNLVRRLPMRPNKFYNNFTKQYFINIEKNYHNFELCNATLETIKKILPCLDTSKAPGLDRMSSKFLKDGAKVSGLSPCM